MSIQDEVRRALQPLINQGLVHMVEAGSCAAYDAVSNPSQHPAITVMVNAEDPEAHRVDIMKLVLQAGLKVELQLEPNLSRLQG